MTVQNVTRMWSRTSANYSSQQLDIFYNRFTLQDGYQVLCTVDTTADEIVSSTLVPQPGDPHPGKSDAYVREVSPERTSPILWTLTVNYEGYELDADSVSIEWSDTTSTEPIDRDYNGVAIVTAANEPVEGLTVELADPVVVIRRRFLFIDQYSIGAYRHAVNSDTFLGWPAGTARLVGYSATNNFKYNAQLEMWDVTARIQFRYPYAGATSTQAWYKRWRHEGLYIKDPVLGIQRARDATGTEVSKPVLLKNSGEQETNPNNAIFKYTQVYGSLPYSALGLI